MSTLAAVTNEQKVRGELVTEKHDHLGNAINILRLNPTMEHEASALAAAYQKYEGKQAALMLLDEFCQSITTGKIFNSDYLNVIYPTSEELPPERQLLADQCWSYVKRFLNPNESAATRPNTAKIVHAQVNSEHVLRNLTDNTEPAQTLLQVINGSYDGTIARMRERLNEMPNVVEQPDNYPKACEILLATFRMLPHTPNVVSAFGTLMPNAEAFAQVPDEKKAAYIQFAFTHPEAIKQLAAQNSLIGYTQVLDRIERNVFTWQDVRAPIAADSRIATMSEIDELLHSRKDWYNVIYERLVQVPFIATLREQASANIVRQAETQGVQKGFEEVRTALLSAFPGAAQAQNANELADLVQRESKMNADIAAEDATEKAAAQMRRDLAHDIAIPDTAKTPQAVSRVIKERLMAIASDLEHVQTVGHALTEAQAALRQTQAELREMNEKYGAIAKFQLPGSAIRQELTLLYNRSGAAKIAGFESLEKFIAVYDRVEPKLKYRILAQAMAVESEQAEREARVRAVRPLLRYIYTENIAPQMPKGMNFERFEAEVYRQYPSFEEQMKAIIVLLQRSNRQTGQKASLKQSIPTKEPVRIPQPVEPHPEPNPAQAPRPEVRALGPNADSFLIQVVKRLDGVGRSVFQNEVQPYLAYRLAMRTESPAAMNAKEISELSQFVTNFYRRTYREIQAPPLLARTGPWNHEVSSLECLVLATRLYWDRVEKNARFGAPAIRGRSNVEQFATYWQPVVEKITAVDEQVRTELTKLGNQKLPVFRFEFNGKRVNMDILQRCVLNGKLNYQEADLLLDHYRRNGILATNPSTLSLHSIITTTMGIPTTIR